VLLYLEGVLASLIPRHMAAGWHRRGEQYRNPYHQEQNHEVEYPHVHASARVMTGDVLDAAVSGAPHAGLDCRPSHKIRADLNANMVSARPLAIDCFLSSCNRLHEVRKARQGWQGSVGVGLDDGAYGI
jgi:hypothetical protein